ncbi:Uncharacterised protein [Corynebacterium renale]|uniref:hypothetical protein n=1 Tax=Corynebacterium renale TaxID=1724 RepID=UPI000DA27D38|nr:hypothetical protein [Corynebacterium renale]SQG65268.1 Uncharacterised protein [Corynebacterium renale]STC98550.1 Uncharacterised protein [Corynebacterium renale]
MNFEVDQQFVADTVQRLNATSEDLDGNVYSTRGNGLARFSRVSGLDHYGRVHSDVLEKHQSSARGLLEKFSAYVNWVSQTLGRNTQVAFLQENLFKAVLGHADVGFDANAEAISFEKAPPITAHPFGITPAVIIPPLSFGELEQQFLTTDTAAMTSGQQSWEEINAGMADLAARFTQLAGDVNTVNTGPQFDRASETLADVAKLANNFSLNGAGVRSGLVGMQAAHGWGSQYVRAAHAALALIPVPAERIAAEQALLQAWPPLWSVFAEFSRPPVETLIGAPTQNNGNGGVAEAKTDAVAVNSFREALAAMTPTSQAEIEHVMRAAPESAQFLRAAVEPPRITGGGALTEIASLAPAAQSAAVPSLGGIAPSIPGSLGPVSGTSPSTALNVGSLPGVSGFGNGAGFGGIGQGGTLRGNVGPGTSRIGSLGHAGALRGNATSGAAGVSGLHGATGAGGVGSPRSGFGGTGFGGAAAGSHAGALGRGLGVSMTGPGTPGGGAGTSGFGSASASQGSASQGVRGGHPMMAGGAPMGAGGSREKKQMKAVTSVVERQGNLKALLGDGDPVVPRLIGR